MSEQKEAKTVNVSKTVDYLNRTFQEACRGLPLAQVAGNYKETGFVPWNPISEREQEGERHYRWQVEAAHLINEIQRGPSYIVPKMITDCNKLIEEVKSYKAQKSKQ